jgi:glycosyltransferase involved in cell wall biosynthesis
VKVVIFLNQLGIGGSEKAACRWARGLDDRGHDIHVLTLRAGPRRAELEASNIDVRISAAEPGSIIQQLEDLKPDVIHTHAPGHPHQGDVLGEAFARIPKIPVVQTNIFGQLQNPRENSWTDFRLFISWTSCVQAARRCFQQLDEKFFRHASVAVYPLDPDNGPTRSETARFRQTLGLQKEDVLFGRLSRPEPNKWTDLPIEAFRIAANRDSRLKLLLREPPPDVTRALAGAFDRNRFIILPATTDAAELALTIASLDAVVHTSIMGESFGYGIAEPMNFGKPVIANSTPGLDQAQIELVRHGECGFIASTAATIAEAMLKLAQDVDLRMKLGQNAKAHIRVLSDPTESIRRLEEILEATASGKNNPHTNEDVAHAQAAAKYLDEEQFGHSLREQVTLWPPYCRMRFHEWRHRFSWR